MRDAGVTNVEIKSSVQQRAKVIPLLPLVHRLQPQSLHYFENLDTKSFHGIRIEFKKGFPKEKGSTAGASYMAMRYLNFAIVCTMTGSGPKRYSLQCKKLTRLGENGHAVQLPRWAAELS